MCVSAGWYGTGSSPLRSQNLRLLPATTAASPFAGPGRCPGSVAHPALTPRHAGQALTLSGDHFVPTSSVEGSAHEAAWGHRVMRRARDVSPDMRVWALDGARVCCDARPCELSMVWSPRCGSCGNAILAARPRQLPQSSSDTEQTVCCCCCCCLCTCVG